MSISTTWRSAWRHPPAGPAGAADAVAACLTRIAVARHGVLPVIRTLARRERASDQIAAF
ncbi:hypothetical protein ACIG5D_33160 [Microbispora rosea]|uniref:hypothetical protein n=1 Tax=Microbispora rosea TaxID=58117 RepID=UPI003449ECC3